MRAWPQLIRWDPLWLGRPRLGHTPALPRQTARFPSGSCAATNGGPATRGPPGAWPHPIRPSGSGVADADLRGLTYFYFQKTYFLFEKP
jgi:hypothetical protein